MLLSIAVIAPGSSRSPRLAWQRESEPCWVSAVKERQIDVALIPTWATANSA
jgi:hypothetical protein